MADNNPPDNGLYLDYEVLDPLQINIQALIDARSRINIDSYPEDVRETIKGVHHMLEITISSLSEILAEVEAGTYPTAKGEADELLYQLAEFADSANGAS